MPWLPGSAWRSWFQCDGGATFDRGLGRADPLLAECAEMRDLARPDDPLRIRIERVSMASTRLTLGGVAESQGRLYFRRVGRSVERAADAGDPLHVLWLASAPQATLVERARAALVALPASTPADCVRRATWLSVADPEGWESAAIARLRTRPDTCAAGLAAALLAAGIPPEPLLAEVEGTPQPEVVRASLASWPEGLLAPLTADLARWDQARDAARLQAQRAHEARVAALDPPLRACWDDMLATLSASPSTAEAGRDPRSVAGRRAAWTLPWALWIPSADGGYVEDGRGGVAWSVAMPPGVPLSPPGAPPGPTALVVGRLEVANLSGAHGEARVVPRLVVACVPTAQLPEALRPSWSVLGGWAEVNPAEVNPAEVNPAEVNPAEVNPAAALP